MNRTPHTTVEWRETSSGMLVPFVGGQEVAWAPQSGSQVEFLSCPVFEVLLHGPRGGGKSQVLLMDYAQHVGQGLGPEWQGIIFRQSYPQLSDLIKQSKQWFPRIFPLATFNESKTQWTWPDGEQLKFAHMPDEDAYWTHGHGKSWGFIGWDELTTWSDDKCYTVMMSACRSPHPKVRKKIRATTNPSGPGVNWVKRRFHLGGENRLKGPIIRDDPNDKSTSRVAIFSDLSENKVLLHADPDYLEKIKQAARNPAELEAWTTGSWDVIAGGMFDDLWTPAYHVIPDFPVDAIPARWRIRRSYDHGQSRPFSVGWWAKSNGEPITFADKQIGSLPGDLIRFAEWYGWNGTPNEGLRMSALEIAEGIRDLEQAWGIQGRVLPGPADSSIFDQYEPGKTVAGDMARRGIRWQPADKGPGSRKHGWEQVRKYLRGSIPQDGFREEPGLFICRRCDNTLRILPVAPRDKRDTDDVDTKSEDHCFAADTPILTPEGSYPISTLVGKIGLVVTSNDTWAPFVNVRMTRRNAELIRVYLSDGSYVDCTPDHEWLTIDGNWVEAQQMTSKVCKEVHDHPLFVEGVRPVPNADTYCLTVPSTGCFALANGAIVSNCLDDIRYFVRGKVRTAKSWSW